MNSDRTIKTIKILEESFRNNADKWPWGIIYVDTSYWGESSLNEKYGGGGELNQETVCINFCEQYSVGIANEGKPDGSGLRYKNPSEILAYCQSHKNEVNMLIVARRDCLSMNTAEYLRYKIALLKEGVEIVSMEDTEFVDSSMEEICEIVAEYQKDTHGDGSNQTV